MSHVTHEDFTPLRNVARGDKYFATTGWYGGANSLLVAIEDSNGGMGYGVRFKVFSAKSFTPWEARITYKKDVISWKDREKQLLRTQYSIHRGREIKWAGNRLASAVKELPAPEPESRQVSARWGHHMDAWMWRS